METTVERPAHLLLTTGLTGMAEFYQKYRLIPASINADVALILSHIAYWSGCNEAARVTVAPSRGHSYQVKHPWDNDRIVRIKDYYDHREGVVGWNTP